VEVWWTGALRVLVGQAWRSSPPTSRHPMKHGRRCCRSVKPLARTRAWGKELSAGRRTHGTVSYSYITRPRGDQFLAWLSARISSPAPRAACWSHPIAQGASRSVFFFIWPRLCSPWPRLPGAWPAPGPRRFSSTGPRGPWSPCHLSANGHGAPCPGPQRRHCEPDHSLKSCSFRDAESRRSAA
jgi:hypothetical protein